MRASLSNARGWLALLVIATAQFMVVMDTSIIGVALPQIQADLGFSQENLSWVFNAYVITAGGLLLLGGRLADLFGARRLFVAGFVVLSAASLLAGLAGSEAVLLAARALQGLGAALIAPAALTLLLILFAHDPKDLTKAFAVYGTAAAAGGTAGVFLGGVLTEWASWEWIFLVNIPIGLAVLAATGALLPASAGRRGSVDVLGALSVTAGIAVVVLGIVRAPEEGWGSPETMLLLAAGVALLGVFVAIQRLRRDPLMPRSIFRAPNLAGANVVVALLGAAWQPVWFFLNLYLQQVLGLGAFEGGAALLPMTIVIMILMVGVTERVVHRLGFKVTLVAGLAILAVGIAGLGLVRSDGSFLTDVLPASLIAAAGMSLAYIPAMLAALSGAQPQEQGLASGIFSTTYQVGSALGLAAITAVASSQGASQLGDLPALTDGFQAAFVVAAAIAAVGALAAAFVLRTPKASTAADPAAELAVP
jgi:EmrB/QacA subfamily drug resistance transporter